MLCNHYYGTKYKLGHATYLYMYRMYSQPYPIDYNSPHLQSTIDKVWVQRMDENYKAYIKEVCVCVCVLVSYQV